MLVSLRNGKEGRGVPFQRMIRLWYRVRLECERYRLGNGYGVTGEVLADGEMNCEAGTYHGCFVITMSG